MAKLGEYASFIMGQAPASSDCNTDGVGTPFVKAGQFGKSVPIIDEWTTNPLKMASSEDVLICVVGATSGKLNRGVDCAIGRSVAAIRPNREAIRDYIYYGLHPWIQRLRGGSQGSAIGVITKDMLDVVEMPFPDVKRQKEIVQILSSIECIIKKREVELGKLDELIKARFVELFGDININDKGWDIEPLGNLCTIVRGGSPRPIEQFLGGDVPWIKIGDATDGDNIYLNSTKEHIIQEGVKKSRLVKAGSLIFANCGVSLGFARIITFDGCIHDGWLAMEDIDERLDKVFLLQTLNQMTEHFRAIAPAGTQPNLNTAIMKAYRQVLPPLELQKEFIAFAKQVDKSKVV